MKSAKRLAFEAADWTRSFVDFMPENPLADPDCPHCKGHGITDSGWVTPLFENCPTCWSAEGVMSEGQ